MGAQHLIDSNAIIDYLSGKLPPNGMAFMHGVVNAVPRVSIVLKSKCWATMLLLQMSSC